MTLSPYSALCNRWPSLVVFSWIPRIIGGWSHIPATTISCSRETCPLAAWSVAPVAADKKIYSKQLHPTPWPTCPLSALPMRRPEPSRQLEIRLPLLVYSLHELRIIQKKRVQSNQQSINSLPRLKTEPNILKRPERVLFTHLVDDLY